MTEASNKNVDQLLADLESKEAARRQAARAALVQIGSPAVPALLEALDASPQHVRWGAAKSLAEIADPAAAEGLAAALGDEDVDVRWVVGEALIVLGRDAIGPLLRMLAKTDLPHDTYQGAHHVVHDLVKRDDLADILEPIRKALDAPDPEVTVPVAATEALENRHI